MSAVQQNPKNVNCVTVKGAMCMNLKVSVKYVVMKYVIVKYLIGM